MKRIYLSGPITGRAEEEYRLHFATVDAFLRGRALGAGIEIDTFNPTSLKLVDVVNPEWHDYMKPCIAELAKCDGIALLDGWDRSNDALLELTVAEELRIPVVFIEPPVTELEIGLLGARNSESLRYWIILYSKWMNTLQDESLSSARSTVEFVNRFLDPHGFEYIKL